MVVHADAALIQRFEEKFVPEPNTGCWLWFANRLPKGYGLFWIGQPTGRSRPQLYAHRAAYAIFVGPVDDDTMVLHRCDTPECVNPDHLFLGDGAANMQDAMAKGRLGGLLTSARTSGELNVKAKLSAEQVRSIRARAAAGERDATIAEEFGVSSALIGMIRRRRIWRDS